MHPCARHQAVKFDSRKSKGTSRSKPRNALVSYSWSHSLNWFLADDYRKRDLQKPTGLPENPEVPMKKSREGHISWNQKCLNKEAMRTRGESRIGILRGVEGGNSEAVRLLLG